MFFGARDEESSGMEGGRVTNKMRTQNAAPPPETPSSTIALHYTVHKHIYNHYALASSIVAVRVMKRILRVTHNLLTTHANTLEHITHSSTLICIVPVYMFFNIRTGGGQKLVKLRHSTCLCLKIY